jgi:hypothetical protein
MVRGPFWQSTHSSFPRGTSPAHADDFAGRRDMLNHSSFNCGEARSIGLESDPAIRALLAACVTGHQPPMVGLRKVLRPLSPPMDAPRCRLRRIDIARPQCGPRPGLSIGPFSFHHQGGDEPQSVPNPLNGSAHGLPSSLISDGPAQNLISADRQRHPRAAAEAPPIRTSADSYRLSPPQDIGYFHRASPLMRDNGH